MTAGLFLIYTTYIAGVKKRNEKKKNLNFTIIRFKEFTGGRVEVLEFKIISSFQSHAEAFGVPTFPPQDVLGKSSGPSAHVTEI